MLDRLDGLSFAIGFVAAGGLGIVLLFAVSWCCVARDADMSSEDYYRLSQWAEKQGKQNGGNT